jgi:hypothetical protein
MLYEGCRFLINSVSFVTLLFKAGISYMTELTADYFGLFAALLYFTVLSYKYQAIIYFKLCCKNNFNI